MARHIVAVCVVCLLCADRIPCEQHLDETLGIPNTLIKNFGRGEDFDGTAALTQDKNYDNDHILNKVDMKKPSIGVYNKRRKRHAGHDHHQNDHDHNNLLSSSQKVLSEKFLQRIFNEYGQKDGTIHFEDFRKMLQRLGLKHLIEEETNFEEKETKNDSNRSCVNDRTLIHHLQYKEEDDHHSHQSSLCNPLCLGESCKEALKSPETKDPEDHHHHPHLENKEKTSSLSNYTINQNDLLSLCPVLLYQLSSPRDSEKSGCLDPVLLETLDCPDGFLDPSSEDYIYKWCYAFMAVFGCSILGLVGVAIIPFMDSRFYKHIIQFFVALAVGTMTGDALLHLMPHSLAGQSETNMIFKGLTCMGGIVFFYITEHGLTMISEWRRRIEKQEQKKPSRAKIMHDADSTIHNSQGGDKLCKSKYSSYPYCYDEIAMAIKKDDKHPQQTNDYPISCSKRNSKVEPDCSESAGATQSLLANTQSNHSPIADISHNAYLKNNHHHHHHQQQQNHSHCTQHMVHDNDIATDIDGNAIGILGNGAGAGGDAKELKPQNPQLLSNEGKPNETVTVILREHESTHHGHSHKHGHVHSPPTSLSAVAWMIIMGDGLHNFTDGMAIGAAFAENIAGGFSTSLAVFCHELPHELGDFAILIKAGMTVRSAVYYNLLTSVLSFIGMCFGMVFGRSQESAQWMFAAAAGLFIYIALVDMLPELSAPHKSFKQLVLQILGMISGVSIMLIIAIYEGDLMTVFASSSSSLNPRQTPITNGIK